MDPRARAWFDRSTHPAAAWPPERVAAAKGSATVSVVLPARDEAATVGTIVAAIHAGLAAGPRPIVDEVLVVDSDSSDGTADIARGAGARVVAAAAVRPDIPAGPGKGEAMWRGLIAAEGDVIVYLDADLESFEPAYVTGLLGPLLADPDRQLVKACYDRPRGGDPRAGGRVTELVARPLLALHRPHLAGIAQPLGGEYAGRRGLLEDLAFPCGYGVDLALLLDTDERYGLDAIAQVDLGIRRHRHHEDAHLAAMAAEVWAAASPRLGLAPVSDPSLVRYDRSPGRGDLTAWETRLTTVERPPVSRLPTPARTAGA